MDKIQEIEKEIKKIISKSKVKIDLKHALSTQIWLVRLKPDVSDYLKVAALGHDIERALDKNYDAKRKNKFDNYIEHKKLHSQKSSEFMIKLLMKHNFDKDFIKKVSNVVLKHEFGGDRDSNLLLNADSLSFFDINLPNYYEVNGEVNTRKKINFMFDRMSKKGQELVKKSFKYEDETLNKIFLEEISK